MVIVVQDGDGEKQLKCELVAAWFPINHLFPSMVQHAIPYHGSATATHHTATIYIFSTTQILVPPSDH